MPDELPDDEWHAALAPGSRIPPSERDSRFSDEDLKWWAFQPIQQPAIPEIPVTLQRWARQPIDHFIGARLAAEGLMPAPEADRATWIRRVTFDLTGLPPTPAEVTAFLSDTSDRAYEDLVERLLASERYGERYARLWLDLVRYAESDGYRVDDYRPNAWRYRDWVVKAFNEDMPYDTFVEAQLAGDELWPDDPQRARVATGFLRHWIYEYNNRDVRGQWNTILNDLTDVTADVFLGMGYQCARCHDHKFDPILQRDYYRLQAFFAPILPRDDLPVATEVEIATHAVALERWKEATIELRSELAILEAPYIEAAGMSALTKFNDDLKELIARPLEKRSVLDYQVAALAYKQVEYEHRRMAGRIHGDDKAHREELIRRLREFDDLKPADLPIAFTATDAAPVAPLVYIPGKSREDPVEPGFLTLLDPTPAEISFIPAESSTGRRATLSQWITSDTNPLTSRVWINRIWQAHFGQGLVATSSDFGRLGEPPSHPELLDWLATRFVRNGWRLKPLHREIVLSATYRQGRPEPEATTFALGIDPGNRLLWSYPTRRIDAEQIRDSLLAVTGELDLKAGGSGVPAAQPRRTIYTRATRNVRDALLDAFDAAESFISVAQRNVTTTPTQSLWMLNSHYMLQRAAAFSARLETEFPAHSASACDDLCCDDDPDSSAPIASPSPKSKDEGRDIVSQRIRQAHLLAYGRPPTPSETSRAREYLDAQQLRLLPVEDPEPPFLSERMPYMESEAAVFTPGSRQEFFHVAKHDFHAPTASPDITVEGLVLLRKAPAAQSIRVLAALEPSENDNAHEGWVLGVGGEGVGERPLSIVFVLISGRESRIVSSGLALELNRPYHVAASLTDIVTFTVKDAANDCEPALVVEADPSLGRPGVESEMLTGAGRFLIGGASAGNCESWEGLVSQVRFTRTALKREQLLSGESPCAPEQSFGWWRFQPKTGPFSDYSPHGHSIQPPPISERDGLAPDKQAWVDLCHVLFNSNEFLYVD